MTLELAAIPLAFLAGMLSILSPCVWPLVPVVMSSATTTRFGPYALALGLSLSFALAGSLLSFFLVSFQLDPELFRYLAAVMLILVGLPLVIKRLGDWLTLHLSRFTAGFDVGSGEGHWSGQFGVGFLLGFVWLPCVGPTLGAAIALASMGQELLMAFTVMFVFGSGTALVLLIAGLLSRSALKKMTPQLASNAVFAKKLLGWMLLLLGFLTLTGLDKVLETWAMGWLPDVALGL